MQYIVQHAVIERRLHYKKYPENQENKFEKKTEVQERLREEGKKEVKLVLKRERG